MKNYVIGLDFGSDSVRAILVNTDNGDILATSVDMYSRWGKGMYSDASKAQFRQHPLDYLEGLEKVLKSVIGECDEPAAIRAISVDTTASTPCLCDRNCTPLCLTEKYAENPDAMFVLWKDHTGQAESEEITALCAKEPTNWAKFSGNYYSAEGYWSKVLHLLRNNSEFRNDAWYAIELCDYIPAILTGNKNADQLKASHCAAAIKHMWSSEWGGFPPASFFNAIDPDLARIAGRMANDNWYCHDMAGHLSEEWAERLGLSTSVLVGVGNVDSHSGATGAGIRYKTMILNMGTSACYMAVMPLERMGGRILEGVFNQVDGSILPGMYGFESGLSALGDLYAWLRKLLAWPLKTMLDDEAKAAEIEDRLLFRLGEEAAKLPLKLDAPIATDYFNGRRSPNPDSGLTGSIMGLTLGTSAPELYYALAEATAFATRAILDHLMDGGVEIDKLIAVGGIPQKSPFVMQMMADVTGMEISIAANANSCAMGAAVHAAVVAGIYSSVEEAHAYMVKPTIKVYRPDPSKKPVLDARYERYIKLGAATAEILQ